MKNLKFFLFLSFLTLLYNACKNKQTKIIDAKEVTPWCIIGVDIEDRISQGRIDMIKELGFSSYSFIKGKGDFSTMKEEFHLAKQNGIKINSIFLWFHTDRDIIGQFSPSNQLILDNLKEINQKPSIWLSFSDNFFEEPNQEESIN